MNSELPYAACLDMLCAVRLHGGTARVNGSQLGTISAPWSVAKLGSHGEIKPDKRDLRRKVRIEKKGVRIRMEKDGKRWKEKNKWRKEWKKERNQSLEPLHLPVASVQPVDAQCFPTVSVVCSSLELKWTLSQ